MFAAQLDPDNHFTHDGLFVDEPFPVKRKCFLFSSGLPIGPRVLMAKGNIATSWCGICLTTARQAVRAFRERGTLL